MAAASSAGLRLGATGATTITDQLTPFPRKLEPRNVSPRPLLQPGMLGFPENRAEEPGPGGSPPPLRALFHSLTSAQLPASGHPARLRHPDPHELCTSLPVLDGVVEELQLPLSHTHRQPSCASRRAFLGWRGALGGGRAGALGHSRPRCIALALRS